MDGYADGVMVALLPVTTGWSTLELPHLTLVYAGEKQFMGPYTFNELSKETATIAMVNKPLTLQVIGLDVFGDEQKVDVIRLKNTPELMKMRKVVESWSVSEYPFNPHVTIGPAGGPIPEIPNALSFDRVALVYGTEVIKFLLNPN